MENTTVKQSTFTFNGKPAPIWLGAIIAIPVAALFVVFATMLVAMWSSIALGIMVISLAAVLLTIPVGLVACVYRLVIGAWPSWFVVEKVEGGDSDH